MTFDQGVVTKAEFERVYAKNNGGREAASAHTPEQLQEYLDLYVHFKRKVFEAEAVGLPETSSFQQEFETYRKQLAQPYMSAKEVEDRLVKEAYDRSGYMVNASHILLNATADAAPADTLAVYKRLLTIRDSIVSGQREFGAMAEAYSQDPSAKNQGGPGYQGNLGYFSAFDMVYPFESAAFQTEVGEVSQPIRTNYGYHLVKVNDRIKTEGQKRVAHIIVRVGERYSAKTDQQAEQKIKEIYEQLQKGTSFAELAAQFSDDPGSASKGGDLGTGRLLPVMEDLKLKLGENEFSEPFQTRFGWHILKVIEVQKMDNFEEAEPMLKQRIQRDSRAQLSRKALINRIKSENQFQAFPATVDSLKATAGANFPRGAWMIGANDSSILELPVFQLMGGDRTYTLNDFNTYFTSKRPRSPRQSPEAAAESALNGFIEAELISYEEAQLPKKNPDFRYLLQEYRDGILLFTLMEQKVWKKAMQDTTGLQTFYESNEETFYAEERIEVTEFRTQEEAQIQQVAKLLQEGATDAVIDSVLNQASALNLRRTTQRFEKGKGELGEEVFGMAVGAVTEPMPQNDFYRILRIEEKMPAGVKSFADAKSEAITRYQDFLEQEWLKELATKYPVKIDDDVFANLFK
ncbi:MAG: peptidylprolyl isomerase [Bacteroidota bacterium]